MGWQDQGRQYHGWFGSGTGSGGDRAAVEATPQDIAAVVAAGAAAYMPDGMRQEFERHLEKGGGLDLVRTIPIWAASSALEAGAFRKRMVGPAMGVEAAGSLQSMARLAAAPGGPEDVRQASAHLAAALKVGEEDWLYDLTYAKDMAVYAAENAKGSDGSAKSATAAAGGSVAVAGAAASPNPLVVVGRAAAAALAVPGAALAAGAVVLFWPRTVADATMTGRGQAPGGGLVMEARQPKPSGRPEPARPEADEGETHDRPPAGSIPIDKTPWSGDHTEIKRRALAKGKDKTVVDPDGGIWSQSPRGSWVSEGDGGTFTGSGRPSGRTGKDREESRHDDDE